MTQEETAAAIQRVRNLHTTKTFTSYIRNETWVYCESCYDEDGYAFTYPCPTIRALDGDE